MKLMIVESPNKVKTISQFLTAKDGWVIKASVGHITKVPDVGLYHLGIDVKGDFDMAWEIDDKKKDVVKELKELVKKADEVYLSTDPDREGEAIAWHLKEQLGIPKKKLKRVTFTEVTKKAVEEAVKKPRKIDDSLVDAAFARLALDKIVGYRCSPVARTKVGAKSVGRCQSAALKLVTEREEEILNFDSKTYYEIWLPFTKDGSDYKAQYKGFIKNKKNTPTINDKQEAIDIANKCNGNKYIVKDITSKDRTLSPKPPFTTATFQQEVSSKLGYSVKKATELAQRLFEGIDIGGVHKALITYIRTDSETMNEEFKDELRTYITNTYGKNYLDDTRKVKKAKNAQEGHECLRCVDLSMTPEKLSSFIMDSQMLKVYELIYNRTIASLMTDATITDTDYVIENSGYKFIYTEKACKFDGFRKVYSLDEEQLTNSINLKKGEEVNGGKLDILEKKTSPPSRYSEATLIKKLTDLGIGRPSTYSTIVSTLIDPGRGYCTEQGKALVPTDKGIRLSKFIDEAFPKIINYDYSASMEDSLDQIAKGKLGKVEFLKSFYGDLEVMLKGARATEGNKPPVEEAEGHTCPNCGKTLVIRNGRFGKFMACPGYPACKYTEKIN